MSLMSVFTTKVVNVSSTVGFNMTGTTGGELGMLLGEHFSTQIDLSSLAVVGYNCS